MGCVDMVRPLTDGFAPLSFGRGLISSDHKKYAKKRIKDSARGMGGVIMTDDLGPGVSAVQVLFVPEVWSGMHILIRWEVEEAKPI